MGIIGRSLSHYKNQVEAYRHKNYGDDPGLLRNLGYACKAFYRSIKRVDTESLISRSINNSPGAPPPPIRKREVRHTLARKLIHPFSREPAEPESLTIHDFKRALDNNLPLPDSVYIDGDLDLSGNLSLKQLPKYLYVNGNLILSECPNLQALSSKKLRVQGDLVVNNCTQLKHITRNLKVAKDLNFTGCTRLKSLPWSVRRLGYRSDSKQRQVHLRQTRISPLFLFSNKKIKFHHPSYYARAESSGQIPTEKEIEKVWLLYSQYQKPFPQLGLASQDRAILYEWLHRLSLSADFYKGKSNFKKSYANRLFGMLELMSKNQEFKQLTMDLIRDASESCSDRVALGLDDIEKLILQKKAEALVYETDAEKNLRALGKQIMHLEELEKYVSRYLKRWSWWPDLDEIEVMLDFKISLRSRLDLPINVEAMHFQDFSGLSKKDKSKAVKHVLKVCDDESFEKFLLCWEPWQKLQEKNNVPDYDDLEECDAPEDEEQVCLLTATTTKTMIIFDGRVYEYNFFKNWHIKKGTDPYTGKPINWREVKRFVASNPVDE